MFTGIVQGTAKVIRIERKNGLHTHTLELKPPLNKGLMIGASVAHNGCCLTITDIREELVSFDLIEETLRITNLGQLEEGEWVNIERAAKYGDEIGGHTMSGHIACTAEIARITASENNRTLWFRLPPDKMKYVMAKGFIGLDGCSLTIGEIHEDMFSVHLIPETLQQTLFGQRQTGDQINVEFDPQTQTIVDTIERVLKEKQLG
ncbi:riboflavin synthase subunit alpha [Vibrio mangrovi]|uniref:Riboflavin synthase n=1 Tax=Vibrio mangrovi TaxID=474394 RepID=A0A1Y6INA5_9VIBR|nr:riboflavin synthase subunit alpha [Vibrio mangrovi]MDW6004057.1 riboflavin synthase subunit alpha [Vibrio mangrovi]SMR99145.1 Riboflavin synthase [Vibrio mangrovi]